MIHCYILQYNVILSNFFKLADLVVDNLMHFGRVQWLNEKSNRGSLVQQDVAENMTVFGA